MNVFLEIMQLENGDIVLREAPDGGEANSSACGPSGRLDHQQEPLLRISFSRELKGLLGQELVDVAEAMIDAATEFLDGQAITLAAPEEPPVVH